MIAMILFTAFIVATPAITTQDLRANWWDFQNPELNKEVDKAVKELNYGLSDLFRMLVADREGNLEEYEYRHKKMYGHFRKSEELFELAATNKVAKKPILLDNLSEETRTRLKRLFGEIDSAKLRVPKTGQEFLEMTAHVIERMRGNVLDLSSPTEREKIQIFEELIRNKILLELIGSNCDVVGQAIR